MLPGSREIGWRIHEAAPDDFEGLWADSFPNNGATTAPVMEDLHQLGLDASYWDAHSTADAPISVMDVSPNMDSPKPAPQLDLWLGNNTYTGMDDERITFVGGGAGSIILASYFVARGLPPANVTIVDPRGATGGIWTESWARSGGFNNPKALRFDDFNSLDLHDRDGDHLLNYLRGIAWDYLGDTGTVHSIATDLRREARGDREWIIRTADGRQIASESVVLATGRMEPRKLNGDRIQSNLDAVAGNVPENELLLERHQRVLTEDELSSGRPIVLIGLGNSTAAMLNQIHAYEDRTGRDVNYTVVTHHTNLAVHYPAERIDGRRSIYRRPKEAYLTGYSGDLERDREAYERVLDEQRIITDTLSVNYDQASGILRLEGGWRDAEMRRPHVFALVGYERDDSLFRSMGALSRGWLADLVGKELRAPNIRPCDGAVQTYKDGYMSNVYAAGAVAATPKNPNAAVIPGIQAQAPHTMLTIAIRNLARTQPHRKASIATR